MKAKVVETFFPIRNVVQSFMILENAIRVFCLVMIFDMKHTESLLFIILYSIDSLDYGHTGLPANEVISDLKDISSLSYQCRNFASFVA